LGYGTISCAQHLKPNVITVLREFVTVALGRTTGAHPSLQHRPAWGGAEGRQWANPGDAGFCPLVALQARVGFWQQARDITGCGSGADLPLFVKIIRAAGLNDRPLPNKEVWRPCGQAPGTPAPTMPRLYHLSRKLYRQVCGIARGSVCAGAQTRSINNQYGTHVTG
jgi:hypothetical protein